MPNQDGAGQQQSAGDRGGARERPVAGPPGPRGRRPARGPRTGRGPRPRSEPRGRLVDTHGPEPGTPPSEVRLAVGTIVGVHGVHGELKLRLSTDAPEHLERVKRVFVGDDESPRRLLGIRFHAGMGLIRLEGVTTPEQGRELAGERVRVPGSQVRPLEPGEFFLYQLIGLAVYDETGNHLGRVTDLMETGAHDVFVVTPAAGRPDILLPNHPDVVLDINPTEGRMVVRPLVYED